MLEYPLYILLIRRSYVRVVPGVPLYRLENRRKSRPDLQVLGTALAKDLSSGTINLCPFIRESKCPIYKN